MDRKFKTLVFLSAASASLGEIALLLYLSVAYSSLNWQLIASSLLLVTGILLAFILFSLRNTVFKNKRRLFYAVIINPVLVSILAGITGLTSQSPNVRGVYVVSGLAMVISVIVGIGVLVYTLSKKSS